jgi:2-aminoadipate transaminase
MVSSIIREVLKITQQPDVISFAGGLPAPEAFPVEQIARAPQQILATIGTRALQYSPTEGYLPLRQFIVDKMARYGIHATEDNVLITSGSQQALDLIGKILIDPGDVVLCEAPTYLGALQAWMAYEARYVTVPADDDGMQVDLIEPILKKRKVKLIYALPNFQNPGGTTISLERRAKLVRLADKYNVPIIEDDPYGELRFEGEHLPPLVVLDERRQQQHHKNSSQFDHGNVIYTSTFSKTLAPGLRLGWIVAPREVTFKLVQAKQGTDLHSSTFDQYIAYEVVKPEGFFVDHVQKIRTMYKAHRDAMVAAMEKYFPPGVRWTRPNGGLFLWVTLPEGIDTYALLPVAVAHKVAFVPGAPFFPETLDQRPKRGKRLPVGHNTMRLNFSNASLSDIEVGIQRLGEVIAQAMAAQH